MQPIRPKRRHIDVGHISVDDLAKGPKAEIVGPAITRRPNIDAMLAHISNISSRLLAQWNAHLDAGGHLDEAELRQFKDIAETTLRQTRVEIEVDKHMASRTSGMTSDQIRESIIDALEKKHVEEDVIDLVLQALGMAA